MRLPGEALVAVQLTKKKLLDCLLTEQPLAHCQIYMALHYHQAYWSAQHADATSTCQSSG